MGFKLVNKVAIVIFLTCGTAQAALHDRGGGLIYDDVLKITWLKDANHVKTSGYDADGIITWERAMTWAANLSYYDSVRNVTYDDWRLPAVTPVNGSTFNYMYSPAGNADKGLNITSPHSELSYMYYVNLGNKGYVDIFGNGPQTGFGLTNTGPFQNMKSSVYWSGTMYAPGTNDVWGFENVIGAQSNYGKVTGSYAWAVRPGDVAAVPEPQTWAMMIAGFGLVGWMMRRRAL